MKKLLIFILFLTLKSFANEADYFPAQIGGAKAPIVSVDSLFNLQGIDISMITRKPMTAIDSYNRPVTLPAGTNFLMQSTLEQIYEGYRKASPFESLFMSNSQTETMNIESPDALKLKAILSELIQIKMQEQILARYGGDSKEVSRQSRSNDELVNVRIKKEGQLEKEVKVNLKKAAEDSALNVDNDIEAIPYRLETDYNGQENWGVKTKTEGKGIFDSCFFGCGKKTDTKSEQIGTSGIAQLIQKKYAAYSDDKKTQSMINYAIRNKRNWKKYLESKNGKCYKYVKDALVYSKLVTSRPEGVSPRYAGEQLTAQGFENIMENSELKNIIKDPAQAPKGAILVYEPVPANRLVKVYDDRKKRYIIVPDYGHIEIKTEVAGQSGFVSDYQSKNSRTGNSLESTDRKLIGIYVKSKAQQITKN